MYTHKLKKVIRDVLPESFQSRFQSDNQHYNDLVSRYYPSNGIIDISSASEDQMGYGQDLKRVLGDYKRAAKKEVDKRALLEK